MKTYIKPEIDITVVNTEKALLAGSSIGTSKDNVNGSTTLSRKQTIIEEDLWLDE